MLQLMFQQEASGKSRYFYMNLLTKDSSKRDNCYSQKDNEDILNVITDIDFVTAINNCVNNFVTNMANRVINICWKNDMLYE